MGMETEKKLLNLPAFDSFKKYLVAFSLGVFTFFLVQAYLISDPHRLSGKNLETYEYLLEQNTILKELSQFIDQQYTARKAVVDENDLDAIQTILTLQQTIQSHIRQLEDGAGTPEWSTAYKTLQGLLDVYQKSQDKLLRSMKAFVPLKDLLLTKSTKPIFDLLSEIKLLAQTPKEQGALHAIASKLTLLEDRLQKALQKQEKLDKSLESLGVPMEAVTVSLGSFLRLVEKKQDIKTEGERLQTLILNYFSSIHQIKTLSVETPTHMKELDGQATLVATFIHDLQIGLQEKQKETFEAFYQESKETKKKSVLLAALMTLLVLGIFLFLFYKVHKPLSSLPSLLAQEMDDDFSPPSLKEIQDILETIEKLKEQFAQEMQNLFQTHVQDTHEKVERKVTLLAGSALELSKVAASIAKIPKIFDQKFTAIHKANDEARLHFRHMVQACEDMKKLLEKAIHQAEFDPSLLTPSSFDALKLTVAQVLSQAHEAAVESQTLGLRFSSLIRTKDETLEVSKLFSKAGTRVNQLARSLKEDLQDFFKKMM